MRKSVLSLVVAVVMTVVTLASSGTCYANDALPIGGKGIFLWQLWTAEKGGSNLNTIIARLKSEGISWLIVKVGDGDSYYNQSGKGLYTWATTYYGSMDSVVSIFHSNGIKILGYQYVYGIPHKYGNTWSETDVANWILDVKGIDGLVIDAEVEYDQLATRVSAAAAYCDSIRAHHPTGFVALSAWSRPSSHSTFPWQSFLDRVQVNMPQAYWGARPTPEANEMNLMSTQFASFANTWLSQGDSAAIKPIMPTGDGYTAAVAAGDITAFCTSSKSTYKYPGVSLWEYSQIKYPYIWDEYAASSVWATATSVSSTEQMPHQFTLSQNYPNPFNPSTMIEYQVPAAGHVTLKVYDVVGREIATLVDEQKASGSYSVRFNSPVNASGIFFYKLQTGSFMETRKMTLMK
jgi:hypothetical protein